jgi:hypothetical protein
MAEYEQELTGGNASARVVRVGRTVRKPWLDNSAAVQSYLGALRSSGVDVPQPLGSDDDGRSIVEYVEGALAIDRLPLGVDDLVRVGRILGTLVYFCDPASPWQRAPNERQRTAPPILP